MYEHFTEETLIILETHIKQANENINKPPSYRHKRGAEFHKHWDADHEIHNISIIHIPSSNL